MYTLGFASDDYLYFGRYKQDAVELGKQVLPNALLSDLFSQSLVFSCEHLSLLA